MSDMRSAFKTKERKLNRLGKEIQDIQDKQDKGEINSFYETEVSGLNSDIQEMMSQRPSLDTQIYVHVIGVPKAHKTSYILDLFACQDLNEVLKLPGKAHYSEHTGCPCLITRENVHDLVLEKWSLFKPERNPVKISLAEFRELYEISKEKFKDIYASNPNVRHEGLGYMLKIVLPEAKTPDAPAFPVVEYPGIAISENTDDSDKAMHEAFQKDMMRVMSLFPGVVVACFVTNLQIPTGHPLMEYKIFLEKYSDLKPPLILSVNAAKGVKGFCGTNRVMEDIENYFPQYKLFDVTLQLVNTKNTENIINDTDYDPPGAHVEEWIKALSEYDSVEQIKAEIKKDGGISFSRDLLNQMTHHANIGEIIDTIYLSDWNERAGKLHEKGQETLKKIASFDLVETLRKEILPIIREARYKQITELYEEHCSQDRPERTHNSEYQSKIKAFWINLIMLYLKQFSSGAPPPGATQPDKCRKAAEALFNALLRKINDGKDGWDFTYVKGGDDTIDKILLVQLNNRLSKLIMEGDHTVYEGFYNCQE